MNLAEDVIRRERQVKECDVKLVAWRVAHKRTAVDSKLEAAEAERLVQRVITLRNERDKLAEQSRANSVATTNKAALDVALADKQQELQLTEAKTKAVGESTEEEAQLKSLSETAKQAYDDLFSLVRKFHVSEELSGDAVAILEHATGAVQDVQPVGSK